MDFLTTTAFIALTIISIRWMTALLNLLTGIPRFIPFQKKTNEISILIPARNEAKNLPTLLKGLTQCDSSVGEIIVYNDQSEDDTAAVIKKWSQHDPRIRLIEGMEVPPGWKGKNHACYHLAKKAGGRYLLFLDADVTVSQEAIDLAFSSLRSDQLTLFSFFPRQEMKTQGEWLLVAR